MICDVSLDFHLHLNTLGLLSVPTGKNRKDFGQKGVGLYLENQVFADIKLYEMFCCGGITADNFRSILDTPCISRLGKAAGLKYSCPFPHFPYRAR